MSAGAALAVDVVVAGAGAAGLMCAIECARRGRSVVVLEGNAEIGRKILISGGGRCNFTNIHTGPGNFISRNPHFAKSALARYTARDFIAMVERHGIRYHEKKLGQLFCDGSASEIVRMLESDCREAGARIITACQIGAVSHQAAFRIDTSAGAYEAQSLVIATGGLSIPKIGATPFGYSIARQFGLGIAACRPALVPLMFSAATQAKFGGLEGVATEAVASSGGASFRERLLFTHHGLSGPAILQVSSYWTPGDSVEINLLPDGDAAVLLRERRTAGDRAEARTILGRILPKRFADRWFQLHPAPKPAAMLSDREIDAIPAGLHRWSVTPSGTAGYEKAEVTAGGVDTAELSSKTMEARRVTGLYFIGEVVDVTGQLGGFNFQWAWASGYSAGQYA